MTISVLDDNIIDRKAETQYDNRETNRHLLISLKPASAQGRVRHDGTL